MRRSEPVRDALAVREEHRAADQSFWTPNPQAAPSTDWRGFLGIDSEGAEPAASPTGTPTGTPVSFAAAAARAEVLQGGTGRGTEHEVLDGDTGRSAEHEAFEDAEMPAYLAAPSDDLLPQR